MSRHITPDGQYPHMTQAAADCFRRAIQVTENLSREVVTTSALLYGVLLDVDVAVLFNRYWTDSAQKVRESSLAHIKAGIPLPPHQTKPIFSSEVEVLITHRLPLGVADLVHILATRSHYNSYTLLRANLPDYVNIYWKAVTRDLRPAANRVRVLTRRVG